MIEIPDAHHHHHHLQLHHTIIIIIVMLLIIIIIIMSIGSPSPQSTFIHIQTIYLSSLIISFFPVPLHCKVPLPMHTQLLISITIIQLYFFLILMHYRQPNAPFFSWAKCSRIHPLKQLLLFIYLTIHNIITESIDSVNHPSMKHVALHLQLRSNHTYTNLLNPVLSPLQNFVQRYYNYLKWFPDFIHGFKKIKSEKQNSSKTASGQGLLIDHLNLLLLCSREAPSLTSNTLGLTVLREDEEGSTVGLTSKAASVASFSK